MNNNILFILLLAVVWSNSVTAGSAKNATHKNGLINFRTNRHTEILLKFRCNKLTKKLELAGGDGGFKLKDKVKSHRTRRTSRKGSIFLPSNKTIALTKVRSLLSSHAGFGKIYGKLADSFRFKDACNRNCGQERHIACHNNLTLSAQCSAGTKVLQFTTEQQDYLLHLHNVVRNKVAGNQTKCESASRMATMQWDPELAEYAVLNAMRCDKQHDFCHTTKEFKYPGQNIGWYRWSQSKYPNLESVLDKLVNDWYREEENVEQKDLDEFHGDGGDKVISHFATIVNEQNSHVGCGAVVAENEGKTSIILTCNYARNNVLKRPVYKKGPSGSLCATGLNAVYKNLCSVKEKYDYNN
ncbi:venom allergen-1-like [Musca autumnalis]|uniref:venom allergen-1-like n=1 Tax=Musca autumnalis TaxID=221902 RepID=UPI003CE90BD2